MIQQIVAATAVVGGLVLAGAGTAVAESAARGASTHSSGTASGNVVQAPVHVPVNVCGDTVSVIGALNPSFGNTCSTK